MNKVYVSDNYIIVEKIGEVVPFPYPRGKAEYNEAEDHFILRKRTNKDITKFNFKDIGTWYNASGTIPYTVESLRTFFRQNTGFEIASWSNGAEFIKENADNYSSLLPGELIGDVVYVRNEEGSKWLPGSLGGTYYPEGWYEWNGTDWIPDNQAISNQFYLNQEQLNNKAEQSDLLTEVQNRLDSVSLLQGEIDLINEKETFEKYLKYIKGLDPDFQLFYINGRLTSIEYTSIVGNLTLELSYLNNLLVKLELIGAPTGVTKTKNLIYNISGELIEINYI